VPAKAARIAALAAVAAACAAATIGVGGGFEARGQNVSAQRPTAGDPVAFVERVVGAVVDDDYRRAWRTLHPAHQLVAPLDDYVSCEWREPIPGRLQSIAVLGVADARRSILGVGTHVPSKAVRLRITIRDMATGERVVVTNTFHAVPVDGRWRWVLPNDRYTLYRSGGCRTAAEDESESL
jgi:hypothetical protein